MLQVLECIIRKEQEPLLALQYQHEYLENTLIFFSTVLIATSRFFTTLLEVRYSIAFLKQFFLSIVLERD